MTGTRVPSDERTSRSLLRLMAGVLPVHDPRELLLGLADGWLEICRAAQAIVGTASTSGDRLVIAASARGREPQWSEANWHPWSAWGRDEVLAALRECGAVDRASPEEPLVVPLRLAGRDVGIAVLTGTSDDPSPQWPADLCDLSARLLVQAAHLEAGREPRQALRRAKLEALAEFAAGAGHEINNPVATIAGRAQMLLASESDPGRRQSLATIGGQAFRIRDMIGDAMLFGRPPRPRCERVDLARVAVDVTGTLRESATEAGCRLALAESENVTVWADPTQLAVVLESLLANAMTAAGRGGTITVSARPGASGGGELTVADDGPGLTEVDREHLFDPFYSGRQAGRGLGFGLSKCWRIVSNHGGRIDVRSVPGRQTAFTVHWPAAPAA